MLLPILILLLLFASNHSLHSQTNLAEKGLETLDWEKLLQTEIVTTGRTFVRNIGEATATAIVVTEQEIQRRNYRSLADVLQDLPDWKIERSSHSPADAFNGFTVRGIRGQDKFIILLNGLRISAAANEFVPIIENYPVHFAKQIEIIYGPASALYGADAFAGVINIITQNPLDDTSGTQVNLSASAGIYSQYDIRGAITTKLANDITLTIAGQYFQDAQPDLSTIPEYQNDFIGIQQLQTGIFKTEFGERKPITPVNTSYGTLLKAHNIFTSLKVRNAEVFYFQNYARIPSANGTTPNNAIYNDDVFVGQSVEVIGANYSRSLSEGLHSLTQITLNSYQMDTESNFRNLFVNMERVYKYASSSMMKIEQLFTLTPKYGLQLTLGGTYELFSAIPRGTDLESPVNTSRSISGIIWGSRSPLTPNGIEADFFPLRYNNTGLLLQAEYNPLPRIYISAGIRYDINSRFGSTINPRAGIVLNSEDGTSIKLMYGSAFLAPTPRQSFGHYGSFFYDSAGTYASTQGTMYSFFWQLPNPDLKPQTAHTLELNITYPVMKRFTVALATYLTYSKGLISQGIDRGITNLYVERDSSGTIVPNGKNYFKGFEVARINTFNNSGEQINYGATITALGDISLYNIQIRWRTDVSFADGFTDPLDDGNTLEIGGISPLMFRFQTDILWGNFSISPRLQLVGEQRFMATVGSGDPSITARPDTRQSMNGYALLNIACQYKVTSNISIFVDIWNALNQRYRNIVEEANPESFERARREGKPLPNLMPGSPQVPFRINGGVNFRL